MPVNFLEKENHERLIAAIIGSMDNKINLKEVHRIYGDDPDVTFNTIEWYLRKLRHKAVELKAVADDTEVPVTKSKGKKTAGGASVKSGRVAKKPAGRKAQVNPDAVEMMLGTENGKVNTVKEEMSDAEV